MYYSKMYNERLNFKNVPIYFFHYFRDEEHYVKAFVATLKPGERFTVPKGTKGDGKEGRFRF